MAEDGEKEHGNFDRGFSLVSRTVNDFERSFPRLDSTVASLDLVFRKRSVVLVPGDDRGARVV